MPLSSRAGIFNDVGQLLPVDGFQGFPFSSQCLKCLDHRLGHTCVRLFRTADDGEVFGLGYAFVASA